MADDDSTGPRDFNPHDAAYKRATSWAHHPSNHHDGSLNNNFYYVEHHHHDLINDNVVNNLVNNLYDYLDNINDDTDYDQSAGQHAPCRHFRPTVNDPSVCANCGRDDVDHDDDNYY